MKNIHTIILLALSLTFIGCTDNKKASATNNAPAIAVNVREVSSNTNNPFLAVSGKIQSVNSADSSTSKCWRYCQERAVVSGNQ